MYSNPLLLQDRPRYCKKKRSITKYILGPGQRVGLATHGIEGSTRNA